MVFDLRIHGFTNCIISDTLYDLSQNLPVWNTIPQTTVKKSGGKDVEHFLKPLTDISGKLFLPAYEWIKKIDEGTYGKVYQATRKIYAQIPDENTGVLHFKCMPDSKETIVIKESLISLTPSEEKQPYIARKKIIENEIDTLMHEAAVLTLAYQAVKRAGMEYTVPKVYEIFLHTKSDNANITQMSSLCISMEYIQGDTLLKYMNTHFKKNTKDLNSLQFLDFVIQLAKILDILQKELRMNHRDIKINNILLRPTPVGTNPILVLIDYGFACIANGVQEPNAELTNIEAGAYFGSRYACFKHGRDMIQFIYSLHCHFPFEDYLTEEVLELIKPYFLVRYKYGIANLFNGLTSSGYHSDKKIHNLAYDEGIYLFLRRPEVDPIHCAPSTILKNINDYLAKNKKQAT
jgi:serine/threonine protein kinase